MYLHCCMSMSACTYEVLIIGEGCIQSYRKFHICVHVHACCVAELSEKLNSELTELRVAYYQLKEEHQQLQDKMKFYSKVQCTCRK